jgi:dynein heavy chain
MGTVELEANEKKSVIEHLVVVHLSVQKFSNDFKMIYKRNNFSTPKNYLDFIKNYMNFLGSKRKLMDSLVRRLDGGLITLARA